MRHGNAHRKLGRTASHRNSLFRNMATELLRHETMRTTIEKAKELRPIVEKLVTLGKNDSLHSRRKAYSYLVDKDVVHKLFAIIGPRFKKREGGYLRIVRADVRPGDAASMAYIEFVEKGTGDAPPPPKGTDKSEAKEKSAKPAKAAKEVSEKAPKKAAAPKKSTTKSKTAAK